MNGYFANTSNCNVVQTPTPLEPRIQALNTASPFVDCLKFLSFRETSLSLFVTRIYLDNWLRSVLAFNSPSQFHAAIGGIANNILWMKFAVGEPRFTEQRGGSTDVMYRSSDNFTGNGQFMFGIGQTEMRLPLTNCYKMCYADVYRMSLMYKCNEYRKRHERLCQQREKV